MIQKVFATGAFAALGLACAGLSSFAVRGHRRIDHAESVYENLVSECEALALEKEYLIRKFEELDQ